MIGDAYNELGNYEGAVEAVQNMVDTRPEPQSYSRVSYVRRTLHGKVAEAIDAMEQAVEAGSPNAENTNWCRVQLGQLYWQQGNLAAAERQYQQVLTYYPQFMYALAAMGQPAPPRQTGRGRRVLSEGDQRGAPAAVCDGAGRYLYQAGQD